MPKHWTRNLPEIGTPLLRNAEAVERLWAQIAELQSQLAVAENRALEAVAPHYSLSEINEAQRYSVADANWRR